MSKAITESDKEVLDQWLKDAREVRDPETLSAFINRLSGDYQHDYGTTVHAAAAIMMAAFWTYNKSPQGGLTGFQAGLVWWRLMEQLTLHHAPAKLVSFHNMLFPQYERYFERTISKGTWEWMQKEAAKRLNVDDLDVHPDVEAHWRSIVDGQVPFGFEVEES